MQKHFHILFAEKGALCQKKDQDNYSVRKATSLLYFQYYSLWFCKVFRHTSNFKNIYFSLKIKTFISTHLRGNCTLKISISVNY